jgi:hypothetical protein
LKKTGIGWNRGKRKLAWQDEHLTKLENKAQIPAGLVLGSWAVLF